MFSSRSILLISFAALCGEINVSAQTFPGQFPQNQQTVQPQVQQQPIQQPYIQQGVIQQQPIQMQPMQAPPFGTQPSAQPAAPQGQFGTNMVQPRVATTNPAPAGQQLYNPGGVPRAPQIVQPGAVQGPQPGMQHVARAEPENRIIPFFLNPVEQRELDEFLIRWERYSAGIKRYDVEFNLLEYNPEIQGAKPNEAQRTSFGEFKYNANPMRFYYAVEGEWRNGKPVKRDGDKNPDIFAEKIIIDDKTFNKYDYNAKTMHQINIPPERIGQGIATSPLPLIFGAKADELKRRFSMKVETKQNGFIWLYARPLLIEDQQEFRELVIILEKDLRAQGLLQHDINGKSRKVYELKSTRINPVLENPLEVIRRFFTPTVPSGWKREITNWADTQPPPAPAVPQMPIAGPSAQPPTQPLFRNEFPLYRAQ